MVRSLREVISDQRIAFLLVGAVNTALGYALFVVLFLLLGDVLPYLAVLVITYFLASLVAFVLQRQVVFRVSGFLVKDLFRFQVVGLGVFAINAGLLIGGVELIGLPVLVAQAGATIVAAILSYLGHKFISFARPKSVGGL